MIEVRVNNLTRQIVGYHQFPALPRRGDQIRFADGHEFTKPFEVVDILFKQPADGFPMDVEIFVLERPHDE